MRILCISDTTRSLAFSSSVGEIFPDVDLILSAGDMPLESYDYVSTMLHSDVLYVYGNHNLKDYRKAVLREHLFGSGVEDSYSTKFYGFMIDGRCYRDPRSGLIVAGLGGSMLYNGGDSQYTERQMMRRILRLVPQLLYNKRRYGRCLDILVTHAPPFGIGDGPDICHRGFKTFLGFIDRFQPRYVLHGHVHLDDMNSERIRQRGSTTIINVYSSYLLEDETLGGKNSGR